MIYPLIYRSRESAWPVVFPFQKGSCGVWGAGCTCPGVCDTRMTSWLSYSTRSVFCMTIFQLLTCNISFWLCSVRFWSVGGILLPISCIFSSLFSAQKHPSFLQASPSPFTPNFQTSPTVVGQPSALPRSVLLRSVGTAGSSSRRGWMRCQRSSLALSPDLLHPFR